MAWAFLLNYMSHLNFSSDVVNFTGMQAKRKQQPYIAMHACFSDGKVQNLDSGLWTVTGLWTGLDHGLDLTMDWTMDWIMDSILEL